MGDTETVSALVTGGQASSGPPLGPSLGPLGVNILQVVNTINEKTKDFEGMKVPVTVQVDKETKDWSVDIGIPSTSSLILKESGAQKGSSKSGVEWAGQVTMDSVAKIAKRKMDSSYATELRKVGKEVVGTCLSLGIKVEGKTPKEITYEIEEGKWDEKFTSS